MRDAEFGQSIRGYGEGEGVAILSSFLPFPTWIWFELGCSCLLFLGVGIVLVCFAREMGSLIFVSIIGRSWLFMEFLLGLELESALMSSALFFCWEGGFSFLFLPSLLVDITIFFLHETLRETFLPITSLAVSHVLWWWFYCCDDSGDAWYSGFLLWYRQLIRCHVLGFSGVAAQATYEVFLPWALSLRRVWWDMMDSRGGVERWVDRWVENMTPSLYYMQWHSGYSIAEAPMK